MYVQVSNEAAQAIVYAINYGLEVTGLERVAAGRFLAIQIAADVKRIMAKELNPSPELGTADVWHEGSRSYYRARLLKKLTLVEANFDPTEEFGG